MTEAEPPADGRAHLLVRAGETVCALPLDAVRRVIDPAALAGGAE